MHYTIFCFAAISSVVELFQSIMDSTNLKFSFALLFTIKIFMGPLKFTGGSACARMKYAAAFECFPKEINK